MELTGKLIKKMPLQTGTGKNGEWKKQDFIIEVPGTYPKKIALVAWGDRANEILNMELGQEIKASIDIESREYNERWYTDVKAWKIEKTTSNGGSVSDGGPKAPEYSNTGGSPFENTTVSNPFENNSNDPSSEQDDDLPF
jgi:hypothetical protein